MLDCLSIEFRASSQGSRTSSKGIPVGGVEEAAAVVVASAIISSRATANSVTGARNRTKLGLVAVAAVGKVVGAC
jgi:hypothetical protein